MAGNNAMIPAKTSKTNLYEQDYVAWADEQALLLEQKRFHELDLVNLVEEVRDLGRRERDAIESQLIRLLMHLLKWQYQPEKRTRSWLLTIKDARRQLAKLRSKYPVLKVHTESVFFECYLQAREVASDETALPLNRLRGISREKGNGIAGKGVEFSFSLLLTRWGKRGGNPLSCRECAWGEMGEPHLLS